MVITLTQFYPETKFNLKHIKSTILNEVIEII